MPILFLVVLFASNLAHSKFDNQDRRILLVGDSLSSNTKYGLNMTQYFRNFSQFCKKGNITFDQVFSYALPSASPRHFVDNQGENKDWLCRQKRIYRNQTDQDMSGQQLCKNLNGKSVFQSLIVKHQPHYVVISLGTNSIGFSSNYIVDKVQTMLSQIPKETQCFWTPPTFVSSKYRERVLKVEKAVKKGIEDSSRSCHFLPTFETLSAQKKCRQFYVSDGIHHTTCGSQLWGEEVFGQICSKTP